MKLPRLKLSTYKNSGGSTSDKVSGTINGERYQKNFPTLELAQRELDERMREFRQGHSVASCSVWTSLPDGPALSDIERAYGRLITKLSGAARTTVVDDYVAAKVVEIRPVAIMRCLR